MESTVTVRELRQHLSKYLAQVSRGVTLQVLSRGQPVALLAPLPRNSSILDRLVAEGRAIPARCDLLEAGPALECGEVAAVMDALMEQRNED